MFSAALHRLLFLAIGMAPATLALARPPALLVFPDATGALATLKSDGGFDRSNPFFQSLGTNGRTCATCHDARQAMSITPAAALARYTASGGNDPLFASV